MYESAVFAYTALVMCPACDVHACAPLWCRIRRAGDASISWDADQPFDIRNHADPTSRSVEQVVVAHRWESLDSEPLPQLVRLDHHLDCARHPEVDRQLRKERCCDPGPPNLAALARSA